MTTEGIDTIFSPIGGFGTRLGDLTKEVPKPLIDINGKTVLERELDWYDSFGIKRVVFGTHYKSEMIEQKFGNRYKGIELLYSKEEQPMGTGGCIKLAEKYLPEKFIFCNGDLLMSFNLYDMIKQHNETGAMITTGLKAVKEPKRFGVVELDGLRVTNFLEKPENPPTNLINAGISVMEGSVLDLIPLQKVSLEREIFPQVVGMKKQYCYLINGPWIDMGIPEDLEIARRIW